jgi:hypothetical protein
MKILNRSNSFDLWYMTNKKRAKGILPLALFLLVDKTVIELVLPSSLRIVQK